jgi:hypothetical protein
VPAENRGTGDRLEPNQSKLPVSQTGDGAPRAQALCLFSTRHGKPTNDAPQARTHARTRTVTRLAATRLGLQFSGPRACLAADLSLSGSTTPCSRSGTDHSLEPWSRRAFVFSVLLINYWLAVLLLVPVSDRGTRGAYCCIASECI